MFIMTDKNSLIQLLSGLFIIALFVLILLYFNKSTEDSNISNKRFCVAEKMKIYNGVVINKFQSRGTIYILRDGSHFSTQCAEGKNRISIGDSLYKPSGTFDYFIYKSANPDSVFFVNCNFDCDLYDK